MISSLFPTVFYGISKNQCWNVYNICQEVENSVENHVQCHTRTAKNVGADIIRPLVNPF